MRDQEEVKRWTAKRKSALVLEIIQGKTTVAEASRAHDLLSSEIENWVDEDKRSMETEPFLLRSDNGLVFTSRYFTT